MGFDHVAEVRSLNDFMPGRSSGAEQVAQAGQSLPAGMPVAAVEAVIDALRTVHDPEIPVNIYDLGLIYDLEIASDGTVSIEMTLTAPACPVAGELPMAVADAVAQVEGTGEVTVRLVWDPPWTAELMSEDARMALGMFA